MSIELLDEVSRGLRLVWVSGSSRPDIGLDETLVDLSERAARGGLPLLAARIDTLRGALGDDLATFEAQLQLWMRLRLLQRGWGVAGLRRKLVEQAGGQVAAPVSPPGWTGTFTPLGAHVVPPKVQIHGLDEQGIWVTFAEVAVAVPDYDRWKGPWLSRLFQDEMRLSDALSHPWDVQDHPGVRTAQRWVGRPAFSRRPRLMARGLVGVDVPALAVGARMGVGRASMHATCGPQGWSATSGGQDVSVSQCLRFNLQKAASVEGPVIHRRGVFLAASAERVLLQWGEPPVFPTLDPTAVLWSVEEVRRKTTGARGAVIRALLARHAGWPPEEVAPTLRGDCIDTRYWASRTGQRVGLEPRDRLANGVEQLSASARSGRPEDLLRAMWWLEGAPGGAALVQAHSEPSVADGVDLLSSVARARWIGLCAQDGMPRAAGILEAEAEALKRRLASDGVLPSLVELYWLSDAISWARGTSRDAALQVLSLPRERLEAALVAPLSAWMASDRCDDDTVVAWAVAASAGLLGSFVTKGDGLRLPT